MVSYDSNRKVTKALAFRIPGLLFPSLLTLIRSVFLVLEGLVSALLLFHHDDVTRASRYLVNHRLSCLWLLPFHPAGMWMNCSLRGMECYLAIKQEREEVKV